MVYQAPERVRWVDPWRKDKGLRTQREERGFFKTKEALEIYVKKYHGKTAEDLQQYWHDNPSESNGIQIPSWSEQAYPRVIYFGIICLVVLAFTPVSLAIFWGYTMLSSYMTEIRLFCDGSEESVFWGGFLLLLTGAWTLNYWFAMWQADGFQFGTTAVATFIIGWSCFYAVFFLAIAPKYEVTDRRVAHDHMLIMFLIPETLITIIERILMESKGLESTLPS